MKTFSVKVVDTLKDGQGCSLPVSPFHQLLMPIYRDKRVKERIQR